MLSHRGVATPEGLEWYRVFARGGVGLVIVEGTDIHRFGRDLTPDALKPLVEAVHAEGASIAIQLFMPPVENRTTPTDLAQTDIRHSLEAFGRAGAVCLEAGFDGLEPHGAHGFLLNQFFSPLANRRQDGYGGGLEGRMALAQEIIKTLREAAGYDCILLYRHTPVMDDYSLEESLMLAESLMVAGVDIMDLSPSSINLPGDLSAPFKARLPIPTVAVGAMHLHERAVTTLREGRADLIALGRGLIADPDWPRKTQEGRFHDIVWCEQCNEGCYGDLDAGRPVMCIKRREPRGS
jgi:2,4-dienoyl-CoA reductase-like NADH-dependent reductase (Old Yellow Enzyme family)